MTMERRHYELIARTIMDICVMSEGEISPRNRTLIARSFAQTLRATNPRFDKERFLKACGATD